MVWGVAGRTDRATVRRAGMSAEPVRPPNPCPLYSIQQVAASCLCLCTSAALAPAVALALVFALAPALLAFMGVHEDSPP